MAIVYYSQSFQSSVDKIKYWNSRIARIYPMLLIALFSCILLLVNLNYNPPGFIEFVSHLFCLQAWIPGLVQRINFPAWAVSVEFFFFLLFPFIMGVYQRLRYRYVFLLTFIIWIASLALQGFLFTSYYQNPPSKIHDIVFYNPALHLNTFLFGIFGGVTYFKIKGLYKGHFTTLGILFSVVALYYLVFGIQIPDVMTCMLHNGLLAPLFFSFLLSLSLNESLTSRVLSYRPLQLLGDMSYSIFILQAPVNFFMYGYVYQSVIDHPFLDFYLYLTVLLTISYAGFLYIETPLRRIIRQSLNKGIPRKSPDQNEESKNKRAMTIKNTATKRSLAGTGKSVRKK